MRGIERFVRPSANTCESDARPFSVSLGLLRHHQSIQFEGADVVCLRKRIDIEKLLQIRLEPEAVEFRTWLSDVDKFCDAESRKRVAGLNARLGLGVQSTKGKVLRLLATTAVGIMNPAAGIIAGVLDQFLWDKFLGCSGVAAFANEPYPSIFDTSKRGGNAVLQP